MDATRFDALTRSLSPGRSRRSALGLLAGAALALARARGTDAQCGPACGGEEECPPENPYWCESLDRCVCRASCCPSCPGCGGGCSEDECIVGATPQKKNRRKKRKKRR